MIHELLKNKVPDYSEIEIFFFEHCDLRCAHCFQDHTSTLGMDESSILSKLSIIENFFKNNQKQIVHMNVMGGELFQDHLLDEFLPIYSKFIKGVNELSVKYNKTIVYCFVTNLMTTRHEQFKNWLDEHSLKINVSYDSSGRFNINQMLLFKRNIEIYKDYINTVSSVATKQNIDIILANKDSYFNYLYENFTYYWDQLTPGPTVPTVLVPSEKQYLDFLLHLIDKYPKCTNLTAFTNKKQHNKMSCPSLNKLVIEANNNTSSCRIEKHKNSTDFISIVRKTNDEIIEKFIDEKDCFSCEYFSRCSFSCFVRYDWKRLVKDFDGCIYKEIYKKVL